MYWEQEKIGGGAAPLKTEQGWLEIYHSKAQDQIYSLFLVLLDLNNPAKVLKRGKKPVLYPQTPYEKKGLFLYYGCCIFFRNMRKYIYLFL